MTKFEYLKSQSNKNIIFTWKALGGGTGLKANSSTKVYSKDSLYLVNVKSSGLYRCIVICTEDCGSVSWGQAFIFDYMHGEITFGNNIVSPNFKVLLSRQDYEGITQDDAFQLEYESFVPFKSLDPNNKEYNPFNDIYNDGPVIIPEEVYRRCISVLGAPFITDEELEYTKEEIIELAIKPALEEYFHWIPNVRPQVVDSMEASTGNKVVSGYDENGKWVVKSSSSSDGNGVDVDMPDDAYGVAGLSLQQSGQSLNTNILSPMFYALEQSLYSGFSYTALTGVYNGRSPYTNTNSIGGMLGSRAASQALINYTRRVHYEGPYPADDDHPNHRWIRIYSTVSGVFNIWWALRSLDFNTIEYANRRRVIEYAQACVKELFGNLRRLAKSDIPGQYDYEKWITEAQQTKQTITDEWKKLVKYAGVMRGSL